MRSNAILVGFLLIAFEALLVRSADDVLGELEQTAEYWRNDAKRYILRKLEETPNLNEAKNVILILGDGMSMQTIAASRMFMGGEEISLSFEDWPHFGLARTYSVDSPVPDSACTASALMAGVKGNSRTVGVNGQVKLSDCEGSADPTKYVDSIAKWAHDSGKASGFVTNARVTHASPSAVFAHSAHRHWENDQEVRKSKCDPLKVQDIAQQLVYGEVGRHLQVVMGGGRREFRNSTVKDETGSPGFRSDGRDLIEEWFEERSSRGNASYIWNKSQLSEIDVDQTDFLLGMFSAGHCPFHEDIERNDLQDTVPTLKEMSIAAIELLSKKPEGYFLFIEGAHIDTAHHKNWARLALEETKEFSHVVETVRKMTNESDTLIVVTADHSHVMSYNGYSKRGNDILGLADSFGSDKLPYPTLSYANGQGFLNTYDTTGARQDMTHTNFSNPQLAYMAMAMYRFGESHGGEDVGVYASGPWSHLFTGNYEQNNIAVAMAYAAQIGPYASAQAQSQSSDGHKLTTTMMMLTFFTTIACALRFISD